MAIWVGSPGMDDAAVEELKCRAPEAWLYVQKLLKKFF